MPKRYDVTTKSLLEAHPEDWLQLLGLEAEIVEVVDADLSTVVADADKALLLSVAGRELLNIEFQSTYEPDMLSRFLEYSILFYRRKGLPVRTVIVLLRPQADRETMTGTLEIADTSGAVYLTFQYATVRIWTIPVERLLSGGLGTLPLAPLADLTAMPVETVVRRMDARIRSETAAPEAEQLWASTYLLMGLRFSPDVAAKLTQGVRGMRESTTYQAILQEGREEGREEGMEQGNKMGAVHEARELLIRIGTKRFGAPSALVLEALSAIEDKERLEQLVERALDVETWKELLVSNTID